MLTFIEGMPQNVIAIEAIGKVTHEDYQNILIPRAEAMMAKGPIRMLYVIGREFAGFELEALWDDTTFGLRHWHDFSRIAVASDLAWLRAAVAMFRPFFRGELRLFALAETSAAKEWISEVEQTNP
jgi:SpoIIAA-like